MMLTKSLNQLIHYDVTKLFLISNNISLTNQLIFLNELKAFNMIGNLNQISKCIARLANTKVNDLIYSKELSIGDKMSLVGFDKQVIVLIANGEKMGRLQESIDAAIRYCELLLDIKKNTTGRLFFGIVLLIISLAGLTLIPTIISDTLDGFINLGVHIQFTFATSILLFLNEYPLFIILLAIFVLLMIGFLYLLLDQFLEFTLFRKIANPFFKYYANYRSLRFLVIWSIYRSVNIALDNNYQLLEQIFGERVYKKIKYQLIEGNSLANAMSNEKHEFSNILISPIASISYLVADDFNKVSRTLVKLLCEEQKRKANLFAMTFNLIGSIIAIFTIALIVYGLIFPVLSVQSSFAI